MEEVDLREKQLAAMRIDICNPETLKKLKGACLSHLFTLVLSVLLQHTDGFWPQDHQWHSFSLKIILTLTISTDKAGGKKFSKDFEEGSAQIQEFIKFLSNHCKTGPPLTQALTNADIFYEMQYKEVKIVANVSDECVSCQKGFCFIVSL